MKIIVKFSSEITIKSRSVRIFFSKILTRNIRTVFKHNKQPIKIIYHWDYLEIICKQNNYVNVSEILVYIPGIHHFLLVQHSTVYSLADIYHQIMLEDYTQFIGKSFCVRIKRYGNHVYSSQEIASYLGNKLRHDIYNAHVNLVQPDKTLFLEIKNNNLFIIIKRYEGLGGLPIGTQQESLSLISGGFDSAVASYMLMRRGCKVHYCFFNLSNTVTHTMEVYKIIFHLWNKFGCSHKIKVISVNFLEIVEEISSKIKSDYIGIVLKRIMIRVAIVIAKNWKIKALITGESLGQVSSQTLDNLVLINDIIPSGCIILRPLITYDKEKIITLARKIGTEVFSRSVPEYCGIISKKSTIKANKQTLDMEESKCNLLVINKVISQAYITDVCHIPKFLMNQYFYPIDTTKNINSDDIILDIRAQYEQNIKPVHFPCHIKIKNIPFYQLIDQFPRLDQDKIYILYCDHGIMSRLQAMYLYQKGFRNIKIYDSVSKVGK